MSSGKPARTAWCYYRQEGGTHASGRPGPERGPEEKLVRQTGVGAVNSKSLLYWLLVIYSHVYLLDRQGRELWRYEYRGALAANVNLFGLAAYLGGRGIEAAVDAYTLRELGFLETCTSGFRRWDVRGRQEPCCFPGCEYYAA